MSELICNELAKSYSHFQLSPTSFQLESGYLTVLAGKNGSGKSTLLRCLAGIDPTPANFRVHFLCENLVDRRRVLRTGEVKLHSHLAPVKL